MSQMEVKSVSTEAAIAALDLESLDGGHFRGMNYPTSTGVVHAGPLMGQMLVAAARTIKGKQVKSFHSVLARMVKPAIMNDLSVDVAHDGRAFGSASVNLEQEGKVAARMLALFHVEEPDLIRHGIPMPQMPAPEDCPRTDIDQQTLPGELRTPPGQNVTDPEATGPADYAFWFRCPQAPEDDVINAALVIPPSVMFAIGAAVRPHPGVGLSMAHRSIDTGVVTQSVSYHRAPSVREWLLYVIESPFAGSGMSFARGQIFMRDGDLVATFQQENIIRQMHEWSRKS
jgi:acyl-CoA thioesterase II